MVELLVAIAIVGLLMAVSVSGSIKLYDSIQYRQSVRDVLTLLGTARQRALDRGRIQDVSFDPTTNTVALGEQEHRLPDEYSLSVTSARELNRERLGIIRFYPEGGSSGGDVLIESSRGRSLMISVDWLMGGITQASPDD
jgi:general secretion pathway protein H